MAIDAKEIERLIQLHIPDACIIIHDLAGDGDHYAAEVTSESFRGKSLLQQHQMVYKALDDVLKKTLHALKLETKIPSKCCDTENHSIRFTSN